jgi:hypothetical protein
MCIHKHLTHVYLHQKNRSLSINDTGKQNLERKIILLRIKCRLKVYEGALSKKRCHTEPFSSEGLELFKILDLDTIFGTFF